MSKALSEDADSTKPALADPCRRVKPRVPPRLAAGCLLLLLAFRLALAAGHARPGVVWPIWLLGSALALALGGCLWWVAHRQVGYAGALLALALYSTSASLPALVLGQAGQVAASLGLFAMLYTGVGVAHALQGPRRKWPQRITLMAGLCGFTALASPAACAAGLLLALLAMLYLSEGRRRVLPLLFLLWAAAGLLAWLLAWLIFAHSHLTLLPGLSDVGTVPSPSLRAAGPDWGVLAACGVALVGWLSMARSRYFGNTAPMLAACALTLVGWAGSGQRWILAAPWAMRGVAALHLPGGYSDITFWAGPFLLLFSAGVFADGLESRAVRLWIGLDAAVWLLQWLQTMQT